MSLDNLDDITATNQELLILAAYFMDYSNETQRELLNAALEDINAATDQASENYIMRIAMEPPGHIDELIKIVHYAEKGRKQHEQLKEKPLLLEW